MKILLVLLISIFFSHVSTGVEVVPYPTNEVWRVGKIYYIFIKEKTSNVLMTAKCLKKKDRCEAYIAAHNKDKISIGETERSGGKNPGAVVCKNKYNGEVLILRNSDDNEAAFCKFKDNSIASVSDLY